MNGGLRTDACPSCGGAGFRTYRDLNDDPSTGAYWRVDTEQKCLTCDGTGNWFNPQMYVNLERTAREAELNGTEVAVDPYVLRRLMMMAESLYPCGVHYARFT